MRINLGSAERLTGRFLDFLSGKHEPTAEHSRRVAQISLRIALAIRPWMDEEFRALAVGALLHDIGKMFVPVAILEKRGQLSKEEWDILHRHPLKGAAMLAGFQALEPSIPIVKHHHERIDGDGYPGYLKGKEIPLGARIVAMADAYDVMVTGCSHSEARSHLSACKSLQDSAGLQFDLEVVAAFVGMAREAPAS